MPPKEKAQKPVASVNKGPNPSAGKKRKSQFEPSAKAAKQAKQSAPALTPDQKKAQDKKNAILSAQNAEANLKQWLNAKRGADCPGGIVKHWLKSRYVELVVQPLPTAEDPNPKASVIHGCRARLSIQSGAPAIRLFSGGGANVFHIRSENIKKPSGGERTIFVDTEYPGDFDPLNLVKAFKGQHWTPGLSDGDSRKLMEWAACEGDDKKDDGQQAGGIHVVAFRVTGDFWFDEISGNGVPNDLKELVEALDCREHAVTVVWKKREFRRAVMDYWVTRMKKAVFEGVWSYYNDAISKLEGCLLKSYEQNLDNEIKHQLWMEITNLRQAKGSIKQFASQIPKKSFGSMRELEIVESVALIYEKMYENQIIRKYFDFDRYHEATVKQATNGYVQLAIKVSKQDEENMPSVTEDSKFAIRKVKLTPPDVEMKDKSGNKVEDVMGERMFLPENAAEPEPEPEPVLPTFTLTGGEFNGRCINVPAEGDFVLSFFISDKAAQKDFVQGERIDVALKMARNPIPTRRMLKAIGRVSKKPGKNDPWRFTAMQKFLKGAGNPNTDYETLKSLKEECFKGMNAREQGIFNQYIASCNMNLHQEAVWKHIFNFRHYLTMLQGPPGTGKTRTVATLAMSFVLLKARTAFCAPSNTAVEECMKNVVENLNLLRTMDPEAADDFLVVWLPTTASTKASLKNLGDEHAAHDFIAEGEGVESDPYREYRLHSHIVRSMQSKVALRSADHEAAEQWLAVLYKLKTKQTVKGKDLRAFVDLGILESAKVLKDPRVRLVLSTSSNADLMNEYGYKPAAMILDEAASCSEPESIIPFSLGARSNVIVGDHEQLKPFLLSRGHNEFARQLDLSMYERFYGHHSVPLFRLKINYRMHPDIAQLPGMLTYEWLGCDPATQAPSDAYNFFNDWFECGEGTAWNNVTRAPAFGGAADPDCRVRWVNTKDSFASAQPGSTSLRNFTNINAALNLVLSLLKHVPSEGIPGLPGSAITFLSPYKEDLKELKKQLGFGIKAKLGPDFLNIPLVQTIDKMQGGQNEIVILLVPPHNVSLLGFMKEFHRWNVGMTRAKSVFWIIGNLDGLRSQLKVLSKGMGCKKLALTIIDYLDRGRVIDVQELPTLPVSYEETPNGATWTNHQNRPRAQDLQLKPPHQKIQKAYDATQQERYEAELLAELKKLRSKAENLQSRFAKGEDFNLALRYFVDDCDVWMMS